jgi:enamine deaminase RidA (YjgF/YER057c/UK114 family)
MTVLESPVVLDETPVRSGALAGQILFGGRPADASPWPVLCVQGPEGPGLSGIQAFPAEGPIHRIHQEGRTVGTRWFDEDAATCLLAGVLPEDPRADRGAQVRSCLERMEAALWEADMGFRHVIRTWFYLDGILAWYDTFNQVRTEFFRERGVFEGLLPASTGIGARNPHRTALVAGALAVRPLGGEVRVQTVDSPLQNPAPDYRSSFSRAVELATPRVRRLLVSGTASIGPRGESLHQGDLRGQVHHTLEVVEALLRARAMAWGNATRAVAYLKDPGDWPTVRDLLRTRGLEDLPVVAAHGTICRSELLFELELDASKPTDVMDRMLHPGLYSHPFSRRNAG